MNGSPGSLIEADFVYATVVNFSFQQNHIPVVRALTITNLSERDFDTVSVTIESEPKLFNTWNKYINQFHHGDKHEFGIFQLSLDPQYLAELTERISGHFTLTIACGSEILYNERFPVDVLAYDQWGGIGTLPELLVSFITPNHPEVSKLIRRASIIMEKWSGTRSFDAYQSKNPNRVRTQMAAVYEAIAEMQLTYCTAPASFEETGQRIRLIDAIVSFRLGNCLDLSLLYAACLEAIGINPLIVILKGHAFTGGWLVDSSFSDPINEDPSMLTKRTADGISEIALVEATCMNTDKITSFDDAARIANESLLQTNDFVFFIDVRRCRFSSRPLPLRIHTSEGWKIVDEDNPERNADSPEEINIGNEIRYSEKIKVSKQIIWERKLLDLTLRNNLLNIRVTKSVIQFITVNPSKFEDALAGGDEFQILAKPLDWNTSLRDAGIYRSAQGSDPVLDLVKQELTQKRLRTHLDDKELTSNLTHLYRSSRVLMEENGANSLYIVIGLLKWYETRLSERAIYAPLLLLPVEIIRKPALKGYIIRAREEETIFNITLLELLRNDYGLSIGGLENLPRDNSGVDVKQVFNTIRQAIMSYPKWDVEEQTLLGIFSFSKFILWNDIHQYSDVLAKNKVVKSLISSKLEWDAYSDRKNISNYDKNVLPASVLLPMSHDSSQLEAIIQAQNDGSFVLHGPPGTGKSQTIANIIASALYSGKKVLFVAAKKAALEVVQERLKGIGIGDFCLELHSNKSKKSAVLQQLKDSTLISERNSPENFSFESDRLFRLRQDINEYVNAVHQTYGFGFSLSDLFDLYGTSIETAPKVFFPESVFGNLTHPKFIQWQDLSAEIQTIGVQTGSPKDHPLKFFDLNVYSNSAREQLKVLIRTIAQQIIILEDDLKATGSILLLEKKNNSRVQLDALKVLTERLRELPEMPSSLFEMDFIEQTIPQVFLVIEQGLLRDSYRMELLSQFDPAILQFKAKEAMRDWKRASEKWLLPRWTGHNAIRNKLNKLNSKGRLSHLDAPRVLELCVQYQEQESIIQDSEFCAKLLGTSWKNGNCDWIKLKECCDKLLEIHRLEVTFENSMSSHPWRNRLSKEFTAGCHAFFGFHEGTLQKFSNSYSELTSSLDLLYNLSGNKKTDPSFSDPNWLPFISSQSKLWLENLDGLKDWIQWLNLKEAALESGLQPLISAYEEGAFTPSEVRGNFEKGFYRSAAEYIVDSKSVLSSFNSPLFEEKISRFREVSRQFELLSIEELYAKLASRVPSFTQEASQNSDVGILLRNIKTNGRATSIRKIFDDIQGILYRLKPCMLMSPISVAQYFDAGSPKFDLVIFDEASQLPTCEAVSAIARGKNLIVVGDPKQLPPTQFFSTNNVDEDNIDKEDLESILDDCLALSMPEHHLRWHYRSKHESLISFSNAKYYENSLLTFPSTDDITSRVQFVAVDGFYDKGKTRQNPFEARAIVEEVVRRLSDPILAAKSIGIVTFSSVQQSLIEDLLSDTFSFQPELEKRALEAKEPIFVKNLENVQGDERDVILFSVGYGPNEEGKVSLTFGPLTRSGGWRRLNVAVSRARYEMKIFSTMRSDQISPSRISSEGVYGLKAFLHYAQTGKTALPNHKPNSSLLGAPTFERNLATEIEKLGYAVNTQIGTSGYKIDIGVVDPENSNVYLLGIICDGKSYFSSKTVRDREIVQIDVLHSLGWNIHRVWSMEWWEKPDRVIAGIRDAIHKAKELNSSNATIFTSPALVVSDGSVVLPKRKPVDTSTIYTVSHPETYLSADSDEFLWSTNRNKIINQIKSVLKVESPISRSLTCKRVLNAWGISRMGSRIDAHLENILNSMNIFQTKQENNIIFWDGNLPSTFSEYRIPKIESEKRDAEDLPVDEIANAVHQILKNQISLPRVDLLREAARLFGYARTGSNVDNAMEMGIAKAIFNGFGQEDGYRVILKEN